MLQGNSEKQIKQDAMIQGAVNSSFHHTIFHRISTELNIPNDIYQIKDYELKSQNGTLCQLEQEIKSSQADKKIDDEMDHEHYQLPPQSALRDEAEELKENIQTNEILPSEEANATQVNYEDQQPVIAIANNQIEVMSKEDEERSSIICKEALINWLNVFTLVAMEIFRLMYDLDYKITVCLLILFDFNGFSIYFKKYSLLKSEDKVDLTQEEILFRREFNKYLLLQATEIFVLLLFKIILILRFEVIDVSLVITSSSLCAFMIFKIVFSLQIQAKEFNPLFNEKLMWIFKVFIGIQSVFIALKLEQEIEWNWTQILWPACVFLILQIIISLGFITIIISQCVQNLQNNPQQQKKNKLIGISWIFSLQAGLTVPSIVYIKALISREQEDDKYFAFVGVIVVIIFFITVTVITFFEWRGVGQFVYQMAQMIQSEQQGLGDIEQGENYHFHFNQKRIKGKIIQTTTENHPKTPKFLKKLSSTYFSAQPDKKENKINNTKNLPPETMRRLQNKEKIKENFKRSSSKKKSQSFMVDKHNPNDSFYLKHEVEINFSRFLESNSKQQSIWKQIAIDTNEKFQKLSNSPKVGNTQTVKKRLFMTPNPSPKICSIHVLSQKQKDIETTSSMKDQTNNACFICFENQPDSVYMPCGHGGVCFECSSHNLQATGECFLCRMPIQEILKMNLHENDKEKGYKVVALATLIDESVEEKQKRGNNHLDHSNDHHHREAVIPIQN